MKDFLALAPHKYCKHGEVGMSVKIQWAVARHTHTSPSFHSFVEIEVLSSLFHFMCPSTSGHFWQLWGTQC